MPQTDRDKAIFASLGNKKQQKKYIEEIVKKSLVKDDKGRDVIRAKSGRLDFTSDFIFKNITPSGNVKTEVITSEAYNGQPEERQTKIGKIYFDEGNENVKLALDNYQFFKTLDDKLPNKPKREEHSAEKLHDRKLADARRRFMHPTFEDHFDESVPAPERNSEALQLLDDQIQRSLNINSLSELRNSPRLKEQYKEKLIEAKIPLDRVGEREIRHLDSHGHTALSLYLNDITNAKIHKVANFDNLGELSAEELKRYDELREKKQ